MDLDKQRKADKNSKPEGQTVVDVKAFENW